MSQVKEGTLQELDHSRLVAQCQNALSQMSNELKDASTYLPAYDQRVYSTVYFTDCTLYTTLIELLAS